MLSLYAEPGSRSTREFTVKGFALTCSDEQRACVCVLVLTNHDICNDATDNYGECLPRMFCLEIAKEKI